jgi:hypothetical protein
MCTPIKTIWILLIKENAVLLVKNKGSSSHILNTFGLPWWKLQEWETFIQCAIRELFEETWLNTSEDNLFLLPTTYTQLISQKSKLINMNLKVYICTQYNGQLVSTIDTEPQWINITTLSDYELLPNVESIIKEGLNLYF